MFECIIDEAIRSIRDTQREMGGEQDERKEDDKTGGGRDGEKIIPHGGTLGDGLQELCYVSHVLTVKIQLLTKDFGTR